MVAEELNLVVMTAIAVIVAVLYVLRVRHMSKLARNGIPGPKPRLISGNLFEWYSKGNAGKLAKQNEWIKKYGKVVGFYMGQKPVILVADAELAKNIQIKDFQKFSDRPAPLPKYGFHPTPASSASLIRSTGKRWKEMRSALTPTFSGAKLKTMTPLMEGAIDCLIEHIDEHSKADKEFDIYDLFQNLTTDVIARCAFGLQSKVQNEANNKFLEAAKAVFNQKPNKLLYILVHCFSHLDPIIYPFRRLHEIILHKWGQSPNGLLYDMAKNIMNFRRENPKYKREDLLQLMMDTRIYEDDVSNLDLTIRAGQGRRGSLTSVPTEKISRNALTLTEDEIIANCVLFYEAGYETTSTALGFAAHVLVKYPEIQETIRQEVIDLYKSDGKLDFNTVGKLHYMEMVLRETLRFFPPVIGFVTRECLADYHYKDIVIPKGSEVMIATYNLHHDPDYWRDPEVFDPERFSPERKADIEKCSFQPFGIGPRNCIGLRFAQFETKLALAKILLNYRLVSGTKNGVDNFATDVKLLTMTPKNGVWVKAVKL